MARRQGEGDQGAGAADDLFPTRVRRGQSTADERERRGEVHRNVRADRLAWGWPFCNARSASGDRGATGEAFQTTIVKDGPTRPFPALSTKRSVKKRNEDGDNRLRKSIEDTLG